MKPCIRSLAYVKIDAHWSDTSKEVGFGRRVIWDVRCAETILYCRALTIISRDHPRHIEESEGGDLAKEFTLVQEKLVDDK